MPVCAQGLSSSPHKKPRVCLGTDSPELCHNQNYYVNYSCLQNCSAITTSNLGTRIISYLWFFFRKEFDVLLFTRLLKVTSSSLYYLSISNAYKGKTSPSFIWKGLGSIRKLECPASGNRQQQQRALYGDQGSTVLKTTISRTHTPMRLLIQNVLPTAIFSVVKGQPAPYPLERDIQYL